MHDDHGGAVPVRVGSNPSTIARVSSSIDAALPAELRGRFVEARLLRRASRGLLLRARHAVTGREVVVKLVERDADRDGDDLAEARLHASVAGVTGVLELLDAGVTTQGWGYLVVPYVTSGSLADEVEAAPLGPDRWAGVALDVLDALVRVHERGVVHGDLKPANVLVGDDGGVLLSDFGCAQRFDAESTLSDSSTVLATLAFAPPERLAGDDAGPAGDVYSAALLLGALRSGHSPQIVPGEPAMSFLERLASGEQPHFDELDLPAPVRDVLRSMAAADPAVRPDAATARDRLAAAVGDAGRSGARSDVASSRERSPVGSRGSAPWRLRWLVAAVLLAVAAGVFGHSIARSSADREALAFCRAYGELGNASSELLASSQERFDISPSFATALETMMNELPRQFAASYQRFERRRSDYPEAIRDDIELAAPLVAKLEMADYLARLDGSFVYDEKRRARLDRLPEGLRAGASAYTAVDQLATATCGLVDSGFPVVKQRLVNRIAEVFLTDGGRFFAEPANAAAIPLDTAELVPQMAPVFIERIVTAWPRFMLSLFDRPEIAAMAIQRHPGFAVRVVEAGVASGWEPPAGTWVSDLRRSLDDAVLTERLDAALAGAADPVPAPVDAGSAGTAGR